MDDKINIIGAFYGNAGKERGADEGGRILKSHLMGRTDVTDGGNIDKYKDSTKRGADCIDEVIDVCSSLNRLVSKSLEEGKRTLIIGGDHSISLGSIPAAAAVAEKNNETFGVIYIDAHGDINTLEGSLTKNIHGTTLAACMGIGDARMTAIADTKLNPRNLLFIATRSLEQLESDLITEKEIEMISAAQIRKVETNLNGILSQIDDFVTKRGLQRIHLSVDIDSVDPKEAPGTGVPELDGITDNTLLSLIEHILTNNNVRSVDFVEYDPMLDVDRKTKNVAENILNTILANISVQPV